VFSANGAAFIATLGQASQGSMQQETSPLKVRFTETRLERALPKYAYHCNCSRSPRPRLQPMQSEGNHWQQTGIGWQATYDKVLLRATPLAKVLRAPCVVNL
jgi:hypothetical protein